MMDGHRQDGPGGGQRPGRGPRNSAWYVSTGHLPSPRQVQAAVDEAYQMYRSDASGGTSQTYPALARVPGHRFGICVAGVNGSVWRAGDTGHEFAIMSVAKPFVFALVCEAIGDEQARHKLGVNASGLPFDSLASVERSADGRSNPMVNSGAIAATSLVPGDGNAAKWAFIRDGLSRFAGRDLMLSEEVYASASATNHRNRAIANLVSPGKGGLGTFSPAPGRGGEQRQRTASGTASVQDARLEPVLLQGPARIPRRRPVAGEPGLTGYLVSPDGGRPRRGCWLAASQSWANAGHGHRSVRR